MAKKKTQAIIAQPGTPADGYTLDVKYDPENNDSFEAKAIFNDGTVKSLGSGGSGGGSYAEVTRIYITGELTDSLTDIAVLNKDDFGKVIEGMKNGKEELVVFDGSFYPSLPWDPTQISDGLTYNGEALDERVFVASPVFDAESNEVYFRFRTLITYFSGSTPYMVSMLFTPQAGYDEGGNVAVIFAKPIPMYIKAQESI